MQWQLVESDEALLEVLARHEHCDTVVVDTEFMRRNTFFPEVALVQLCFVSDDPAQDFAWLVDPLKIADTAPLARLLDNNGVLKVLHSASEDLEVFQRWLGVLPAPMFDTQKAAALLDLGFGMGYRALVQQICDVDLPKGETRSDWLKRPLTGSQCEYAAQDVIWLAKVWRELSARCNAQDKNDWVLGDGRDAIAVSLGGDEFYKRIKSAWKLEPRRLGALAAICAWREETARRRNKPRGWIIDDPTCLHIAMADPRSMAQLDGDLGLAPQVLRRHGKELLELLAQQRDLPEDQLPPRLPQPLSSGQRDQVKQLKARVRELAGGLKVAPEALASGKDYELLLREAAGESPTLPPHWSGWREEQVLDPLRQFLAKGAS